MSPVFTDLAYAVVLGSAFGIGVCLLIALAPRWGAPSLARRIAPYVREVTDPLGYVGPARSLDTLHHAVRERLRRATRSSPGIDRRLRQAGWRMDAASFRGRQLAAAVVGVVLGGIAVVGLALLGRGSPALWLLPPVLAVTAVLLCDMWLTRAASARMGRIEEELPTVLEFLALCLSAGEGILDALRRVSGTGGGELTGELRQVVIAVSTGQALPEALTGLSGRLEIPALSRSLDQLVAAIDRGAPLAHVLQAQAQDARDDAKRTLIEQAGKKEIYMLIPLVFLILPLSVLFAVFPGIFMLRLGIG